MRRLRAGFLGLLLGGILWNGGVNSACAAEKDDYPTVKNFLQCPKCKASFEATPHPLDYRQCARCQAALEKAMGYLKKNFKPSAFGLILDSFFGGFAFMMEGNSEKELAVCVRNCRDLIVKKEPDGGAAGGDWIGGNWCGWKKSMGMLFLAEYSLRNGLTPENKAALIEGAKFAAETQEKGGGWFHGYYKDRPYSPDIAIIGCIYYAAFLEMKALGLDPGPIMDQTRVYLESISDGKTVGYSKGWHGGMGGGGHGGFIQIGLLGSGNGEDRWGQGLANWMKQNYMDAAHGHANGELHYFALGAGLHRLGHEHYAKFASCHIHRLLAVQKDDGGIPDMAHDTKSENEYFDASKINPKSSYSATAVFACLLMMERPGTFSALPAKPAGSISNKDAFKRGTDAEAKGDHATALKYFALVLPPGDNGELITEARARMRAIEALAAERLRAIQTQDAALSAMSKEKPDSAEEIAAYTDVIRAYEALQKDFAGAKVVAEAAKQCEPLKRALSNKRTRMAYSGKSPSVGASVPAGKRPAQDDWREKLRARTAEVAKSGGTPRFESKLFGGRVTVQAVNGDQLAIVLAAGGKMDAPWSQLKSEECRSLAVNLAAAQGNPADHALAAYFMLCDGESTKAEDHLAKAGAEAAAVRAAFGEIIR